MRRHIHSKRYPPPLSPNDSVGTVLDLHQHPLISCGQSFFRSDFAVSRTTTGNKRDFVFVLRPHSPLQFSTLINQRLYFWFHQSWSNALYNSIHCHGEQNDITRKSVDRFAVLYLLLRSSIRNCPSMVLWLQGSQVQNGNRWSSARVSAQL